jgi:hypothetical protein
VYPTDSRFPVQNTSAGLVCRFKLFAQAILTALFDKFYIGRLKIGGRGGELDNVRASPPS